MSAMTKFTRSGKKVVIVGKLNDTSWIVQEVYVTPDGAELPQGENFVETSLLDAPIETWQKRDLKKDEDRKKKLESDVESLRREISGLSVKASVKRLMEKCSDAYPDFDVQQLDTVVAFLSGNITHVVTQEYGRFSIQTLADALQSLDTDYGNVKLDGLKLLSLFGVTSECKRHEGSKPFDLEWRINQYRDGSGGCWVTVCPCQSLQEAVSKLDALVSKQEKATEKTIALKQKYGLENPTQDKIDAYYQQQRDAKVENIARLRKQIAELEDDETKDVKP